jgi:hypothetical protein
MFNIENFLISLPILGWGMLGIFIVIGIIMLCVIALDKIFPAEKDK